MTPARGARDFLRNGPAISSPWMAAAHVRMSDASVDVDVEGVASVEEGVVGVVRGIDDVLDGGPRVGGW